MYRDFWTKLSRIFPKPDGTGFDADRAAECLGISPWTIGRWKRDCPPLWAIKAVDSHYRSIPQNRDWDGFRFVDNRLHTPFKGLSFSAADLLHIFYERQFAAMDQAAKESLKKQLAAVRSDEERRAILEEIESVKRSLEAVQNSPLLVASWQGQTVKRK